MKNSTVRTLAIVLAIVVLIAIVGLAAAAWLFTRSFNMTTVDEAGAAARFEEIRGRFPGVKPLLDVSGGDAVLARRPPARSSGTRLSSLNVVAWNPNDKDLVRLELPFWLLRLKSGPIEIGREAGGVGRTLDLTVEDLERYGPTLVVDHTGSDGERVLVWTH